MHSSISSTSLARLMPREIHADVNSGVILVKYLREIEEREAKHEAKHEESLLLMAMVIV